MAMKILAIMGSPRRNGNTYKIVSLIEDRMKALGDVEFSYLFLKDANLELCQGCWQCLSWSEERCPLKDDREQIEKQILASDGVILASPVYAMNMTAIMKNFLDRFAYTLHRPRFFNQYAMIISTTGALGLKETIDRLSVVQFAGYSIVHTAGFATPSEPVSEKYRIKIQKGVSEAAEKFYQTIDGRKSFSPKLINLMAFRGQQAAFSLGHQFGLGAADYNYFKEHGWLDKGRKYYVDIKVNPLKNMIAVLVEKIARMGMLKELQEAAKQRDGEEIKS